MMEDPSQQVKRVSGNSGLCRSYFVDSSRTIRSGFFFHFYKYWLSFFSTRFSSNIYIRQWLGFV